MTSIEGGRRRTRMKVSWTPDTIACLIIIVGGLALRFTGIDGEIWTLVLAAFGWLCKGQYDERKLRKGR
jgi:hypothetical protein